MKRILIHILFLLPASLFAQSPPDTSAISRDTEQVLIFKNNYEIEELQGEIEWLKQRYEERANQHQNTLDQISLQLNSASLYLTVFGVVFALIGVALGAFVSNIERRTDRMRGQVQNLLRETEQVRDEVVSINTKIQSDVKGLFQKLHREETLHLLHRLVMVPEDITNLNPLLFSRSLKDQDYETLKTAYINLTTEPHFEPNTPITGLGAENLYLLMFFQHFHEVAFKDNEVRPKLAEFYFLGVKSSFKNDMLEATQGFVTAIVDRGIVKNRYEINRFLEAVSLSQYSGFKPLYEVLFQGLYEKKLRFRFFSIINEEDTCRTAKSIFGRLLLEEYTSTELEKSEELALDHARELLN